MVSPSGKQQTTIINESGLYSLILSSKLPSARTFKRWVTSEVIPSIRQTGGYGVIDVVPEPEIRHFSPSEVLRAMEIIANCESDRVEYIARLAEEMIGSSSRPFDVPCGFSPKEKIEILMRYFNESQNKLAIRMGTQGCSLSKWRNGSSEPSNIDKIRWAKKLGIREDYFL